MILESKITPRLVEVEASTCTDDALKPNQAIVKPSGVGEGHGQEILRDTASPPMDVIVLSATSCPEDRSPTEGTKPDLRSCCSEQSSDANTAECSAITGESLDPIISSSDISIKTICTQRSILRSESRISESQKKPSHQRKRKVRFGTVVVRDYGIILGDHPCCSCGPPLTIEWDYHQYEPLDVDEYEFENALSRRSIREICLNYYQRKHLLSGYTELDFKAAKKEIKRIKSRRNISRRLSPIEAALESVCRKFRKV